MKSCCYNRGFIWQHEHASNQEMSVQQIQPYLHVQWSMIMRERKHLLLWYNIRLGRYDKLKDESMKSGCHFSQNVQTNLKINTQFLERFQMSLSPAPGYTGHNRGSSNGSEMQPAFWSANRLVVDFKILPFPSWAIWITVKKQAEHRKWNYLASYNWFFSHFL